jgi:hypothetical protein
VTFPGLRALGVPEESLSSFLEEFMAGAAARADRVGDVGPSAPQHWVPVFTDPGLHLVVSLFSGSPRGRWSVPRTTYWKGSTPA